MGGTHATVAAGTVAMLYRRQFNIQRPHKNTTHTFITLLSWRTPNIAGTALNEKVTKKYTRPSRNNKVQRPDRASPYGNRYSATLVNTRIMKSNAIATAEHQDLTFVARSPEYLLEKNVVCKNLASSLMTTHLSATGSQAASMMNMPRQRIPQWARLKKMRGIMMYFFLSQSAILFGRDVENRARGWKRQKLTSESSTTSRRQG